MAGVGLCRAVCGPAGPGTASDAAVRLQQLPASCSTAGAAFSAHAVLACLRIHCYELAKPLPLVLLHR